MSRVVREIQEPLQELPVAVRHAVVGAALLGTIGAVVGLVIGLHAYAPTAPVALLEVGVPAAVLGGLLGLLSGSAVWACRRTRAPGRR